MDPRASPLSRLAGYTKDAPHAARRTPHAAPEAGHVRSGACGARRAGWAATRKRGFCLTSGLVFDKWSFFLTSGHTTSKDALYAGVPVVSLPSDRMVARVAAAGAPTPTHTHTHHTPHTTHQRDVPRPSESPVSIA